MIRLAIIGYGKWGRRLVHSVQANSTVVRFSAIASRSPDRIAGEAQALDAAVLPSLEAALSHPDVDGIVLATPHSLHAAQVIACARAGKPVFVEKPFTLTLESAERALAAAPDDLVVAVGHNRRFLPAVEALGEMIAAGELGDILYIESNYSGNVAGSYRPEQWRVAAGESPAGGLAGAGIHMIDLIVHLGAPVASVYAQSTRQALNVPMDDTTAAMFTLTTGAMAALTTVMATAPAFRFQVFGTKGSAELRGETTLETVGTDGRSQSRQFDAVDTECAELEAFGRAIAGEAAFPVSRPDILAGIAAFEAVIRSAESGERVHLT